MSWLFKKAKEVYLEEGKKEFFQRTIRYLVVETFRILSIPFTILMLWIEGRSINSVLYLIDYGKNADRIDPLINPPVESPSYVSEKWRNSHISRYVFSESKITSIDFDNTSHLDLACGTGYGSAILENKVNNYIGIDISEGAVNYAEKYYNHGEYCQGEATQIPIQNNEFNTITCFETIEHIRDHRVALNELDRVLSPSGELFVSVPYEENLTSRENKKEYPHLHTYSTSEFNDILESAFQRENIDLYLQFNGGWEENGGYMHGIYPADDIDPGLDPDSIIAHIY